MVMDLSGNKKPAEAGLGGRWIDTEGVTYPRPVSTAHG
jgi:hypothetical protein